MKYKVILTLLLIPLLSSKCKKEGDDCHYAIEVINKSSDQVIYSLKGTLGRDSSKCLLSKTAELNPNESYDQDLKMCWEDELKERDFEFYIVDPSNFNEGGFYDCDSIEQRNTILKHYIITQNDLDDLRANNFTITYP